MRWRTDWGETPNAICQVCPPIGQLPSFAKLTSKIGNVQLNPAQAIIVRVAVTDLLTRLAVDHELRDSLGEVGQIYERRLLEVQSLIVDSINAKPGR